IDMHAHSDFSLLVVPSAEAKVRQGVTTEVTGMCGFSPAPARPGGGLSPEWAAFLSTALAWDWTSFGSWLDRLRQAGLTANVVPFVGHGTLRIATMGFAPRPPTADEQGRMAALLADALDAGAFGLSTGLIYAPSVYAETAELVALGRLLAARPGRLYASHIRGEGPTLERAIAEAIEIGEHGGVPVQVSHLKACLKANWPKMGEALRMLDDARRGRVDITADMYPYTAGSTTLASLLPPWTHDGGGPEEGHGRKPRPRQHGCFAKILGTYVRERGTLTWAEAVHKMTGQSAARLGLSDRGAVRPGAVADLVVFDPETVADRATYQDPHRYPSGIRWACVNGGAAVE